MISFWFWLGAEADEIHDRHAETLDEIREAMRQAFEDDGFITVHGL